RRAGAESQAVSARRSKHGEGCADAVRACQATAARSGRGSVEDAAAGGCECGSDAQDSVAGVEDMDTAGLRDGWQ
ncbi:hypothetical protein EU64_15055, partial [Staphylococcus aureus]